LAYGPWVNAPRDRAKHRRQSARGEGLKGYSGVPALAAALRKGAAKGLGRTNLYAIERGEEEVVTYGSLVEIANACDVPIEFFTADFWSGSRRSPTTLERSSPQR
jgi:transcriptional regulator with XRE-family HTH domain